MSLENLRMLKESILGENSNKSISKVRVPVEVNGQTFQLPENSLHNFKGFLEYFDTISDMTIEKLMRKDAVDSIDKRWHSSYGNGKEEVDYNDIVDYYDHAWNNTDNLEKLEAWWKSNLKK